MPKHKQSKSSYIIPVLSGSIVVLAILCLILAIVLIHKNKARADAKSPSISLGSMQYVFTSGRAVKRDDASVKNLKAFLEANAAHEGCSTQAPAYEHVIAYSRDESQVFLKYGCGAADSPMFAVKTSGAWKMLSPTNHFDIFGIPDCTYVADNNISKEIAPVCSDGAATGAPTYHVR